MHAKEVKCKILENTWLTPTVLQVRFEPNKKFSFLPGQFLSIYAPHREEKKRAGRRAYSFANSPEEAKKEGYQLCVKYKKEGWGTEYLASLKPGDEFKATAPYGDFIYETSEENRNVCFIATSTGIAPFRSMVRSQLFEENPPQRALLLFGAKEGEILYRGDFEKKGVEVVYAVTQGNGESQDFQGRVTDYLRSLPNSWIWHNTDFYLCGNGKMIQEVEEILHGGHGVDKNSIRKEAFASSPKKAA